MDVQPLFSFLYERQPEWMREAVEVERIIYRDPSSALIKSRKWMETLVLWLIKEEGIVDVYEKLVERIRKLREEEIITEPVYETMEWIRLEGNKASHRIGYGTVEESLKAHRHLYHLAVWWMEVYGSADFQAPPYRHPTVDNEVDAAEIERVISRTLDEKFSRLIAIMGPREERVATTATTHPQVHGVKTASFVLADYLNDQGLEVIDNRQSGGTLWVVGGWELNEVLFPLKERKIYFRFTRKGGRASKYKPAWFLLNKASKEL